MSPACILELPRLLLPTAGARISVMPAHALCAQLMQ